jgi:tetratricopeptide (TPR) repeat protein
MTKKHVLAAFFSFLTGVFACAQNTGVDYFNTGELEIAKKIFESQLSQNPPEANYYLGEIAYSKGDLAEAKSHYEQGAAASPEYALNNVGLGKLLLKSGDAKGAEKLFDAALKKDKKNVETIVAIARAYYQNGLTVKSDSKLDDARKANKKSPLIYILEGDRLKDAGKIGDAAGSYAQAIYYAPNYTVPYIKTAQVYEQINAALAIENLNHVLQIDPNYILAYKYLGNVYYKNGRYADAIDAYKKFFENGEYGIDDLTHYAASLFFNKNYDEAQKLISEGIQKAPDNFVLNRLLVYSAVELEDYANGVKTADKFFALNRGANDNYIARDYVSYGKLLLENGQIDKALQQYDEAIKLDPTQFDLYKEIASTLSESGRAADAAAYLQKYIDLAGDKVIAEDYYNIGRYYYMAAGSSMKDTIDADAPAKTRKYLHEADAAFTTVATRVPESHLGYFWRARANSLLDAISFSETGARPTLAKPYYEETIKILQAKGGNNNSILIEAYRYLSSYYYLTYDELKKAEDKALAVEYSHKLLELDPENVQAKQIVEALK